MTKELNKRLEKIENMLAEINRKVNMLLLDQIVEVDEDEVENIELTLGVSVKEQKRPKIPKRVILTKKEKEIVRVIYEAGSEGADLEAISKEASLSKEQCQKLIGRIMKKKVPIQCSKDLQIYRFEQCVMEAQALHNFLQLNKN